MARGATSLGEKILKCLTRKLKWQMLFKSNILYIIGKLFQRGCLKWCLIFEVMNIKLSKNENLGVIFPTLFLPWQLNILLLGGQGFLPRGQRSIGKFDLWLFVSHNIPFIMSNLKCKIILNIGLIWTIFIPWTFLSNIRELATWGNLILFSLGGEGNLKNLTPNFSFCHNFLFISQIKNERSF